MGKRYTVVFEKDAPSGAWTATIDRAQGVSCVTQGRSIGEARKRIREALGLYLDDDKAAAAAELVEKFKLPGAGLSGAVSKALRAREQSTKAQEIAQQAAAMAARQLTVAGLSTRDAAELLDLSHQRVHQYASKAPVQVERRAAAVAAKKRAH